MLNACRRGWAAWVDRGLWRCGQAWVPVSAALLSVVSGLAVGAVPPSWHWAHDWRLLSAVTAGLVLAAVAVAVVQAHSLGSGEQSGGPTVRVGKIRAATVNISAAAHDVPGAEKRPEPRERKARDQLRQYLGRRDRLRRMDETSALALRVHPAIGLPRPLEPTAALRAEAGSRPGHPRRRFLPRPRRGRPDDAQTLDQDLPAFVGRDRGPEIASWMGGAREVGGFLVLVGDSSVGKTRLLYETAREVLPDFAVLAPDLGDGGLVNSIAEATFPLPKLIVWLDEFQRFLDGRYLTPGSTSITATAVRHLLDAPTPVVVLGAMWREHARKLRATEPDPHTDGQRPLYPGAADILADGHR